MKFFSHLEVASFIQRPNRFVLEAEIGGKKISAFLPNPGRLQELLFPGSLIYLEKHTSQGDRKYAYTAVAVERDGKPVFLHTHKNNDLAEYLLRNRMIPAFADAQILQREYTVGKSRFDFLLKKETKEILLEVKSCTLFGEKMAMFPDAVSARATKHIEELAHLKSPRVQGAVLFLVQSVKPDFFLPEYHTDLVFSQALIRHRKKLIIEALGVEWKKDLSFPDQIKPISIPWKIAEKEAKDRGCFFLLCHLPRSQKIGPEKGKKISLPPGYYIYAGSAPMDLSRIIARFRRKGKKNPQGIELFLEKASIYADLPILTADTLPCSLSLALSRIANPIPSFEALGCTCPSHFFQMEEDPLDNRAFHALLQYYRMDRLVGE